MLKQIVLEGIPYSGLLLFFELVITSRLILTANCWAVLMDSGVLIVILEINRRHCLSAIEHRNKSERLVRRSPVLHHLIAVHHLH